MWHFLAKVGRKPWAKSATAMIVFAVPSGYLGTHVWGHRMIRNLFVADDGYNNQAEISDKLKSLILTVTTDLKDHINQSMMPELSIDLESFKSEPSPIKFFASSTLMPISFGLTMSKKGSLIGLPNYMNFDKVQELPDNLFFVKKVRLLRQDTTGANEKEGVDAKIDQPDPSVLNSTEKDPTIVQRLDRNDPDVKKYAESLILSDGAKKFVIARELFFSDSSRVLLKAGVIAVSCIVSLSLSRVAVRYFKLEDAHVSQRTLVYSLAGFMGAFYYMFVSDLSHREFALEADKKAATFSKEYHDGAKEFFQKTIERNKALRDLVEEFKAIYDERGNLKTPIIRTKTVPLDERYKLVRREQPPASKEVFDKTE